MKPLIYSENYSLKISKQQKETLQKMKSYNVDVSRFVRNAITEKIKRDYAELIPKPKKVYCPF